MADNKELEVVKKTIELVEHTLHWNCIKLCHTMDLLVKELMEE